MGTSGKLKVTGKLAFAELNHKCAHCGYGEISEILEVHHKDINRKK